MVNKPSPEFFRRRTEQDKHTKCWLWTGYVQSGGYGQFTHSGGVISLAHRMSYIVHNGPIPAGLDVLHECDTPLCCNPKHLFLGTDLDNHRDAVAKGRKLDRVPVWATRIRRIRKLTDEQVRRIRAGGYVPKELAKELGVSQSTISEVKNGRRKTLVV